MKRVLACLIIFALGTDAAAAQQPPRTSRGRADRPAPRAEAPNPPAPVLRDDDAQQTRQEFGEILRQYPPSLAMVLRLDPSLLANEAYLAPYPRVSAYLADHPEIAHNPAFFVGTGYPGFDGSGQHDTAARAAIEIFEGLWVLLGILGVTGTVAWLLRSLIEHRRWLRLSKVQTDAHTKLLDRLTSNEDVLAYVQSTPGRKFLEAAPIALSSATQSLAAPFGRILWSLQVGAVIGFAGLGLLFVSRRLATTGVAYGADVSLFSVGAVAVAVGLGFVASAALAYVISGRLGLFTNATRSMMDTNQPHA